MIFYRLIKPLPLLVLLFMTFAPTHGLYGQRLGGRVINQKDSTAISNAHVINLSQGRGTTTQREGTFSISVMKGDTVFFQALGFHNDTLKITDELYRETDRILVKMIPKAYELTGVDVFPYATFSEFKHAFIHFKDTMPTYLDDFELPDIGFLFPRNRGAGIAIEGPITMLYEQFSRSGRERREYRRIKEEERKFALVNERVNYSVVRGLTDLEDEQEIDRFLDYCNLSFEFITESREYQVYQAIVACYRRYQAVRP